eukprot:CAMPEP_0198146132 /NCGR_PEP_ID=MMETSP1443-20131203/27601_1 /TAXON_ID=186043 /ORGANISM="Entomoneis sp., Strain CCMP2396" /LENGTH=334 /DNA_ID=CAMNT_0043809979 /DNA_START=1 /DNA_END=1002 /DNA_ORIENTATION=-
MGYTVPETRALFLKEPNLWRASVKTGLIPRMRFLVRDMEIPRDVLATIVTKNPRMLLYSMDYNLVPKLIFYCIMTLDMNPDHIRKLLTSFPQFMDYNLDRHTLPISRYFIKDLEFSPSEFRCILLAYPKLVSNSLSKIKHMVVFLRYEIGLTGTQVKRVLYQAPQVLGLRDANVRDKVQFLEKAFDFDAEELQSVLSGMPRLLVLNVQRNLKPKILYLRQAFDGNQESLRSAILRLPPLLGYSLEQRITPRMKSILQEPSLEPSCITVGITLKSDKFESWLMKRKQKLMKKPKPDKASEFDESIIRNSLVDSENRPGPIVHWTRPRRPRRVNPF